MPPPAQAPAIHAVLFDYGLVLSGPPLPAAWQSMKEILSSEEAAFHAAYWYPRHAYDRGDLNSTEYWRAVADHVGKPLDDASLASLIAADTALWTQPNPDMIAWAAELQRAGVKTGILSNIGDAMEAGVLSQCPWLEDFHHHTFSHNLGIAKPELAIYRHAAEGLGVPPENILFIDDREENIAAAVAVGMQAVQYSDHTSFVHTMQERGFGHLLHPGNPVSSPQ